MKKASHQILIIGLLIVCSCSSTKQVMTSQYGKKDGIVEWIFLQLNDVYEIAPIENGKAGGLARVATIKQRLLNENPNVYTVLAGDFLSPSVIGTLRYEGKGIKGRQMIEVLNALGLNLAAFGNHEFDLDYVDLQQRFDESKFEWIASNAFKTEGEGITMFGKNNGNDPFEEYKILQFNDGASGESVKVGLWSVVVPANKKDYVQYSDMYERSKSLVDDVLSKEAQVTVGLTHVAIEEDIEIAKQNPSVALIMGGHEHNNMLHKIGKTIITKADANAKTVYVHRCSYNLTTKQTTIKSTLIKIDDTVPEDPSVATVVKKWTDIADNAFKSNGFNPNEVVANVSEALDGREATVRLYQTNLGGMIAQSFAAAARQPVDCAFFNSGSIRIDDQVMGELTQADIVRILPFGGKLIEFDIRGSELRKVLTAGLLSSGKGGFLQWYKIAFNDATQTLIINGSVLEDNRVYHAITNEFLMSGKESNFDFFTQNNPNILNIQQPDANDPNDVRNDLRKAFIKYLKSKR